MRYKQNVNLRLRDRRRYVHSTDIYPAIIEHARLAGAPVISDLKIDFVRLVQCQLNIVLYDTGSDDIALDTPFSFSYSSTADNYAGYFFDCCTPVTETYVSDDDTIYKQLHVSGDKLTIDDPTGDFEPIDVVAALSAKHELLEPATDGRKWLVARLELAAPLPQQQPQVFQSRIERRLGTTRIRSLLLIDGQKIGRVVLVQGLA